MTAPFRVFLARGSPFIGRFAVDVALDGEQFVDAAHDLLGDGRLGEPRQVEEVAPAVRPARGLEDRPGLRPSA